jgi:hypothetical protein
VRSARAWLLSLAIAAAAGLSARAQTQVEDKRGAQAQVRLPLAGAREVGGEPFAWLEVSAARAEYFVDEPIHLTVRIGLDVEFMHTNLLQLFTQTLDVPVQLQAPWIDDLPGAQTGADRAIAPEQLGESWASFALNDSIARARRVEDRERDGRKFAVFEIERVYFASVNGRLSVPAPHLRFACATRFERNLIADPVPLDWQLATAVGNALELSIDSLPETGRPVEFTGAVGRFTISAAVATPNVSVGESFKLVLCIAGEGNLEFLRAPRLSELGGFHVRGVLDEVVAGQRSITYDLAAKSTAAKEVPSIDFAYFDTGNPSGYRILHTQPITLNVRATPGGSIDGPTDTDATGAASPHPVGPGVGFAARGSVLMLLITWSVLPISLGLLAVVVIKWRKRNSGSRHGEM